MIILPTEKSFNWNNPPWILMFLIAFNIGLYFFYQSNDESKWQKAATLYEQGEYFSKEWPIYKQYLHDNGMDRRRYQMLELYDERHWQRLSSEILMDKSFYQYLKNTDNEIETHSLETQDWLFKRDDIQKKINTVSYLRFGLTPNDLSILTVLSHQFLHGSFMHLLGNLFFLLVAGFAVEAAIGHWRFLSFYVIGGSVAGLTHSLVDLESSIPLVGASGAISAVMAMYLLIFRFKTIEFFYWFYIFIGYFRAPALFILPFYVGKEFYEYFNNADSNVAYMAHAGGFLAGSLLMAANHFFQRDFIDKEYIDEDQRMDPKQIQQQEIFIALEGFRLKKALELLNSLLSSSEKTNKSFDNFLLKARLLWLLEDVEAEEFSMTLLQKSKLTRAELLQQATFFQQQENKLNLTNEHLMQFGIRFCSLDEPLLAESMFKRLSQVEYKHADMSLFARKLAIIYERRQHAKLAAFYHDYADTEMICGRTP